MSASRTWPPVTMATQHPDNASAPWWKKESAFISTQDEIPELLELFTKLPIDEYMWDWEGKYVDEAVGEKLLSRAHDLFTKRPLGEDIHLTYRIPAYEDGKLRKYARAFMNVLSLKDLANDVGCPHPLVSEMFLPLCTSAKQPLSVVATFDEVAAFHSRLFHDKKASKYADWMHVTPLVEDVDSLLSIRKILAPYWKSLQKTKRIDAERGLRIFIARSDPAMNASLIPAVLAAKVALAESMSLGEEMGVDVHPIIGTGSLPFRGSVNPLYTETFLPQYAGVRTYSIQSAFRYDYERKDVERALKEIQKIAPTLTAHPVTTSQKKKIERVAKIFSAIWKSTIEDIAPLINSVARAIPPRRERLQHIGLFGYSRGIGKVKLPRAIGFTAALYSIGVPPELIATGRGLKIAQREGLLDVIEVLYPALRADLQHAGKYLNRENLALLASKQSVFHDIQEDIAGIESVLKMSLAPEKTRHSIHRHLTSSILSRLEDGEDGIERATQDVIEAGVIRRSLG